MKAERVVILHDGHIALDIEGVYWRNIRHENTMPPAWPIEEVKEMNMKHHPKLLEATEMNARCHWFRLADRIGKHLARM